MSLFSFRKDEILRKKKLIDRLFAEGTSFFIYPYKVIWLPAPVESPFPAQILIAVTKRAFRHAVDRNRIKRQTREIYRINKHELYEHLDKKNSQAAIAMIYTANIHLSSEELETKIKAIFKRLINEFDKKLNNPSPSLSD
jgi:ribonuclease P protein component